METHILSEMIEAIELVFPSPKYGWVLRNDPERGYFAHIHSNAYTKKDGRLVLDFSAKSYQPTPDGALLVAYTEALRMKDLRYEGLLN